MLMIIPLAVDEVVVTGQLLAQSIREGKSLWRTFGKAGILEGAGPDERSLRFTSPSGS